VTECDGDNVESREGDSEDAEDCTSDDNCCNEMGATENCFHWRGQDEVGKGKKKVLHTLDADGKIFWQIYPGLSAKLGRPLRPPKRGTVSLRMKF
jgi:hypothetical protein